MRARRLLISLCLTAALSLGIVGSAAAHQTGPCVSTAEPGHSEFARHHIVPQAHAGTLGAGGHVPGAHRGFSACNPPGK